MWNRFEMVETESIQIAVEQLRITPAEIGRYAGGSRYRLDEKMQPMAEDMLEKATQLVMPVFTYAVHPAEFNDLQKGPQLKSGRHVEVPEEEKDPETTALAAVVSNACQGCFMHLTPQLTHVLMAGNRIVHCPNCSRLLYMP